MFTKEAIELTPATIEALKKLGERKCPECKGTKAVAYTDGSFTCKTCNGIGKVSGWKWKPDIGKHVVYDGKKAVIVDISGLEIRLKVDMGDYWRSAYVEQKNFTPILPWERCFEILVKAGYSAQMDYSTGHKSFCTIKRPGLTCTDFGSSPIDATYKAITRLGEEVKKH